MIIIPLTNAASQTLDVQLSGAVYRINVYQKSTGLFLDVSAGSQLLVGGVLCLASVRLIRDAYLGFPGDLAFIDLQGNSDPVSTGLGDRYLLGYFP